MPATTSKRPSRPEPANGHREAEPETLVPEVIERDMTSATMALGLRADIDSQIATAKNYPRQLSSFKRNALDRATLDLETARSCFYALQRSGGKPILGPSVRLAEIIATTYGNMRVSSKIVGEQGHFIIAEAKAIDLESNVGIEIQVSRRISDKNGRRYSDDMIGVTTAAAISFAYRNAIFRVVPRAYVDPILAECRAVVNRDGAGSLHEDRQFLMKRWRSEGVSPERVYAVLGAKGIDDIQTDQCLHMQGIANSIDAGEYTAQEAFPPLEPVGPKTKGSDALAAKLGVPPKAATSGQKPDASPPPDGDGGMGDRE